MAEEVPKSKRPKGSCFCDFSRFCE